MYELPYGFCGIMCALCNRHIVNGSSGCNGCSHNGYYSEPCKVANCCREKQVLHCALCEAFPCDKVKKVGDFSDLDTKEHYVKVCRCITENGFDFWYDEYLERQKLLMMALEKYNNGKMKRYLCELFMSKELKILQQIMEEAKSLSGSQKEISSNFKIIVNNIIK